MKKWIAIILSLVLVFSVFACAPSEDEPDTTEPAGASDPVDEADPDDDPDDEPDPVEPGDELTLENIKVGFVHITDPSDQGYTYNHNRGTEKMAEELGLREDQIINKFNMAETSDSENAMRELVE